MSNIVYVCPKVILKILFEISRKLKWNFMQKFKMCFVLFRNEKKKFLHTVHNALVRDNNYSQDNENV